jgi:uncharacterized protein YigE (DUF2233 family)
MRALFLAAMALAALGASSAEAACEPDIFEGNTYTVCRFDLRRDRLAFFNLDEQGTAYGSFSALGDALKKRGKTLAFAMNAGMYDETQRPIGLYVEKGRQLKKLNRRDGAGNFHMKPNGVFYIAGQTGGVLDTDAFAKKGLKPDFATQSGPMLVIDGELHPDFSSDGYSRKRRNGVGAVDGHKVVFAISETEVNFHAFATYFRDRLSCRNALFLDGTVSSLHAPEMGRSDAFFPLGPMVALVK